MAKTLLADCSLLEHSLLHMWVPVAGVKTAADFCRKNIEKFLNLDDDRFDVIAQQMFKLVPHILKEYLIVLEYLVFKTNFVIYFDIDPPFQLNEVILTGSLSEDLFLMGAKPPDMDFMCVLKNISFSLEDQKNGNLLLREDTPFVYAFITNEETKSLWREFLEEPESHNSKKNSLRLSSRKIKEKLKENSQKTASMFDIFDKEQFEEVSNGAAITINNTKTAVWSIPAFLVELMGKSNSPLSELSRLAIEDNHARKKLEHLTYKLAPSSDIVLAVPCNAWPFCAEEWITRERLWPEKHLMLKIAKAGYHIVPKSSQEGNFRLSFSCAETKLIETLSPLQHKVMRAFKAAVKYNQHKWRPNINKILSSYHLKTTAFWYFEKTPKTSWTAENLVHHLVSLLEKLSEALRNNNLPMYFMPKVNLLKDVDDPDETLEAMEKISQLCQDFYALYKAVESADISNFLAFIDTF